MKHVIINDILNSMTPHLTSDQLREITDVSEKTAWMVDYFTWMI